MKKYITVFEVPDGYTPTDYLENADGYFTDEEGNRCTVGTKLEEVKQGEWISKHLWDNTHIWVCSECGNQNTHGITVEKACWKCGAQMKGGAE